MERANGTEVQEFILLGFQIGQQKRFLLLIIFAIIYMVTLAENLSIVALVHIDAQLAKIPMYMLLSQFCWLEACYVSSTVPRMLYDLAFSHGVISFRACFLQYYIFFSLGCTESFYLSAVALDRYLAICHPLRYPQLMVPNTCHKLVASCWIIGFLCHSVPVFLISRLYFCGPNIIDHFLCDPGPILSLVCPPIDNFPIVYQFSTTAIILLGNLFFIVLSYSIVVITLMKNSRSGSRKKAFSTVSVHLMVVTLFYGSAAGMYVAPGAEDQSDIMKVVTLFYTAVTPVLNPLIYCLRNNQVKEAVGRLKKRKVRWLNRKETS